MSEPIPPGGADEPFPASAFVAGTEFVVRRSDAHVVVAGCPHCEIEYQFSTAAPDTEHARELIVEHINAVHPIEIEAAVEETESA